MVDGAVDVAHVLAPRLAALLDQAATAMVCAPPEYLPMDVMTATMQHLHGPDGFVIVDADSPTASDELHAALVASAGVLVRFWEGRQYDSKIHRLIADELTFGNTMGHIVVVVETDDPPVDVEQPSFHLLLGSQHLVLTDEETIQLYPRLADDSTKLHSLLHHTGGVPGLIALNGEGRQSAAGMTMVAGEWAERIFDRVAADPMLSIHMWVGRLHEDTVAALVAHLLGEEIDRARLRQARSASFMTVTSAHDPAMPDVLASELRRRWHQADPEAIRRNKEVLLNAVTKVPGIRGMERIRLLSNFHAWDHLERVLARNLHVLLGTSMVQRKVLADVWTGQIPASRPNLTRAYAFVSGEWLRGEGMLPVPWMGMTHLVGSEAEAAQPRVAKEFRRRMRMAMPSARNHRPDELVTHVQDGAEWLRREFQQTLADPDPDRDEVMVLVVALVGLTDAAISVGAVAVAHEATAQGLHLLDMEGMEDHWYPALRTSLVARAALLAREAGVPAVAISREAEFEGLAEKVGSRDPQADRIVGFSKRFGSSDVWESKEDAPIVIDPGEAYAAYAMEAEALRAFLVQGEVGLTWVHAWLERAVWSGRPAWHWWPVHALLAMMDARVRRLESARQWRQVGSLPVELGLVVDAAIAYASGRVDDASELAADVLRRPTSLGRWRVLAAGIKIAADLGSPRWPTGGEPLLQGIDWRSHARDVVLLPDEARRLLMDKLPVEYRALPGIRIVEAPQPEQEVHLTPRQFDVLRGLAAGLTMSEIADHLVLSTETVRSTSKSLYRRLGVHDRDAAVMLARKLSLI